MREEKKKKIKYLCYMKERISIFYKLIIFIFIIIIIVDVHLLCSHCVPAKPGAHLHT